MSGCKRSTHTEDILKTLLCALSVNLTLKIATKCFAGHSGLCWYITPWQWQQSHLDNGNYHTLTMATITPWQWQLSHLAMATITIGQWQLSHLDSGNYHTMMRQLSHHDDGNYHTLTMATTTLWQWQQSHHDKGNNHTMTMATITPWQCQQ